MRRLCLFLSLVAFAVVAHAETVKGRIQVVSKQAATIQIDVQGKKVVVRTDANTRYDGAAGLKDLNPPDLIEVERQPGKAATSIKKIVFGLPPGPSCGRREAFDQAGCGPVSCVSQWSGRSTGEGDRARSGL